jgi:hypothetical protein
MSFKAVSSLQALREVICVQTISYRSHACYIPAHANLLHLITLISRDNTNCEAMMFAEHYYVILLMSQVPQHLVPKHPQSIHFS